MDAIFFRHLDKLLHGILMYPAVLIYGVHHGVKRIDVVFQLQRGFAKSFRHSG